MQDASVMEENPFPELKIANFEFLSNLETREKCGRCGKSRMYYCYTCFAPLSSLSSQLPYVKLPFKVHVIKHPGEVCGKSTAVHAAVLAPEDVTIFTYPDIPEYKADVRVVLVYPGGNAVTVQDYVRGLAVTNENSCPVSKNRDAAEISVDTADTSSEEVRVEKATNMTPVDLVNSRPRSKESDDELEEKISRHGVEGGAQESHPGETAEKKYHTTCKLEESNECNTEQMSDFSGQEHQPVTYGSGKAKLPGFPDLSVDQSRSRIDVVVFIDSTWFQVHKISSDPRLSGLQRIELTLHDTKFWRPQRDKPSTYLSTIEAMYYCVREYHECSSDVGYDGQYDNLLFFFCFFYHKIKTLASKTGKKLKAYHQERRKRPKTT